MNNDEYWSQETFLFNGVFDYYRGEPRQVRAQIHLSDEKYRRDRLDPEYPVLEHKTGTRTYVHMQPYILRPNYTITVALYPHPKNEAIGEVVKSGLAEKPMQRDEAGNAQLWYYPEDRILLLWECFLGSRLRAAQLLPDQNMRKLWEGVEKWALGQFPDTKLIAVPNWEPLFDRAQYQRFLNTLGYTQHPEAKAVFHKIIKEG